MINDSVLGEGLDHYDVYVFLVSHSVELHCISRTR